MQNPRHNPRPAQRSCRQRAGAIKGQGGAGSFMQTQQTQDGHFIHRKQPSSRRGSNSCRARRHLGAWTLALLAAASSALAQPGKPPAATAAPASASSAAKAKKSAPTATPATKEAEGFSIAPAPAWVLPLLPEASTGLPSAPLQVLLMDRQTRIEPSGTVRYQHVLRQINEASGLQKGAQIELDFDPSFQKLQFHRLEVWRDGKRLDRLERKRIKLLHREPQLERQIIDGRMTASIVLEDLRVGDRVEWAVSLIGDNPVFGGKFVDQEWTSSSAGPVGLAQL